MMESGTTKHTRHELTFTLLKSVLFMTTGMVSLHHGQIMLVDDGSLAPEHAVPMQSEQHHSVSSFELQASFPVVEL